MKRLKVGLCFVLTLMLFSNCVGVSSALVESNADVSTRTETLIFGDANGDGRVNSTDYAYLTKYLAEVLEAFPYDKAILTMDLNGDGLINSTDYSILKRFLINVISSFSVTDVIDSMPQKVFEYNYENYAWMSYDDGVYIDKEGNIHSYNNIEKEDTIIGNIPIVELQEKYLFLLKANSGKISEEFQMGADGGAETYKGYISNVEGEGTIEVLLLQEGDVQQQNESQYAAELVDWIRSF